MLRRLDPLADAHRVLAIYEQAADYVWLESGRLPGMSLVEEYFEDAPPGHEPGSSLKIGMFAEDRLLGIADLALGYPEPRDGYIGLMLIGAEARGSGLGRRFLRSLEAIALDNGIRRLLLTVLRENVRGREFWEREGFGSPMIYTPDTTIGHRRHVCLRLEKALATRAGGFDGSYVPAAEAREAAPRVDPE